MPLALQNFGLRHCQHLGGVSAKQVMMSECINQLQVLFKPIEALYIGVF